MADRKNPKDKPEEDGVAAEAATTESGTSVAGEASKLTSQDDTAEGAEGADTTGASEVSGDDTESADSDDIGQAPEDAAETGAEFDSPADGPADGPADDATRPSPWETKAEDTDDLTPGGDTVQDLSAQGDGPKDPEPDTKTPGEPAPDPEPDTTPPQDPTPEPEPDSPPSPGKAAEDAAPQVIRETVVQKRAGFVPTLIGGVIAAAAGFLGAQYESDDWPFAASGTDPFQSQVRATLETQQSTLDTLTERVGTVEGALTGLDSSEIDTTVADLGSQLNALSSRLTDLADQIGLLQVRLVELEKAPIAETVSPDAIAAYERELEALREDITQQRTDIENMASEAMAAEENAAAQAELAKVRAALADLTAALESGQPFSSAVSTISAAEGVPVPEVLNTTASDGVPTRNALVEDFPQVARAALAAARDASAPEQGTANRFTVFLRDQLGARSIIPREGDDPDAVLSRAEAALKSGDLNTALTELDALPPEAQAEMQGWIDRARLRAEVQDAAATLSQELNKQ